MAQLKNRRFLYSAVSGDEGTVPPYDYVSRTALIGQKSTLTSSIDYAVICWRKSNLAVVESDKLDILDLSQGVFSDLGDELQNEIITAFMSLSEKVRYLHASQVQNLKTRLFSKSEHGLMQSEYMDYIKRVKSAGLSSDSFPVIRPCAGNVELSYYPLDFNLEELADVPLARIYTVLVKVCPEKICPIFSVNYDVIVAPDRVMNFHPVRPLKAPFVVKKSEMPNRKSLAAQVRSGFGYQEPTFANRLKALFFRQPALKSSPNV